MTGTVQSPPSSYTPPRSLIEIQLCRLLFRVMLNDKNIRIEFGDDNGEANDRSDATFVLAPPTLWTTIRLILAPSLWVGESFIAGAWYLKKGNLSEFLRLIRKDANGGFKKYYEITSSIRGARYYLTQYILHNTYYTSITHVR